MNDAVVIGAEDELVGGVIVEAGYEVIDGVGLGDMRAVFLADEITADLAPVFVKELEIVADLSVYFSNFGQKGSLEKDRGVVLHIIIEAGFQKHFRLVFYDVVQFNHGVPGDGLEHIGILIFRRVDREVLLLAFRQPDHRPVPGVPRRPFRDEEIIALFENDSERVRRLAARGITDLKYVRLAVVLLREIQAVDLRRITLAVRKEGDVAGLAPTKEPPHIPPENDLIFERDRNSFGQQRPVHGLLIHIVLGRFHVRVPHLNSTETIASRECSVKVFDETDKIFEPQGKKVDAAFAVPMPQIDLPVFEMEEKEEIERKEIAMLREPDRYHHADVPAAEIMKEKESRMN